MCGRPAVCFSNPTAQRAPQTAFPRTLPQCQARCAKRYEPRSSFACPRPATSPLRACPPPLAYVAPRQPRTGTPSGVCRRRNTAAALRARRARGVAAHRANALPRRAARVAALRASAGFSSAIPPRACSPCGACLRSPARELGAPRAVAASPPRYARPRRVRLRLRLRLALAAARSPPAPFCPPFARGGVASLPPSCHSYRIASRAPPAWKGSRCSQSVSCKGALRRALALPSLGREHAARFACPLARFSRAFLIAGLQPAQADDMKVTLCERATPK